MVDCYKLQNSCPQPEPIIGEKPMDGLYKLHSYADPHKKTSETADAATNHINTIDCSCNGRISKASYRGNNKQIHTLCGYI
jgi:hypothetical protein